MMLSCLHCDNKSNYKCPICRQPYCSVDCYKRHKEAPCEAPPSPEPNCNQQENRRNYEYPTEDTIPIEKLQLLGNSTELKKCLENHHVRAIIDKLDKAQYPDGLLNEFMLEAIFTEFVDECLKIVQPQEKSS